jgi:hypothetical protein
VIALYIKGRKRGWRVVITDLVVPGIGAVADVWLLLSLDVNAKVSAAIWVTLRRIPPPEVAM